MEDYEEVIKMIELLQATKRLRMAKSLLDIDTNGDP